MSMRVHISLPVADLEAALNFYTGLFGQEPSKLREDYANFRLAEPPVHLALERSNDANKRFGDAGHSHFGIELPDPDTFARWRERLTAADAGVRDEPDAVCCYARADKVWLTDPDGNQWEIWVRTGEADVMLPEESNCCNAA